MGERENWSQKAIICPPHDDVGIPEPDRLLPGRNRQVHFHEDSNVGREKWYLRHNWLKMTNTDEVAKTTEGIQKSKPLAVYKPNDRIHVYGTNMPSAPN